MSRSSYRRESDIPTNYTFGFEAEFDVGAHELAEYLYEKNLMGSPELHGYHCDCETCYVGGDGYPLHAQRDSSCNGEFISRILTHDTVGVDGRTPTDIMAELEAGTVEVDAEPGSGSGCHVHVGKSHLMEVNEYGDLTTTDAAREAFWAFIRWENVLVRLAAGRFQSQRDGNNYPVRPHILRHLNTYMGSASGTGLGSLSIYEANADRLASAKDMAYSFHYGNDRHSNLNINTRKPTWEFRLWNSTRAAWRMELWTRLSVALMDPAVHAVLNEAELVQRVTDSAFERLASYLDNCGHSRAAELVERQATYARDLAPTAPSTLTVLV